MTELQSRVEMLAQAIEAKDADIDQLSKEKEQEIEKAKHLQEKYQAQLRTTDKLSEQVCFLWLN